jgi:hypothetical protein
MKTDMELRQEEIERVDKMHEENRKKEEKGK